MTCASGFCDLLTAARIQRICVPHMLAKHVQPVCREQREPSYQTMLVGFASRLRADVDKLLLFDCENRERIVLHLIHVGLLVYR